jgi:hypothetical protein
MKTRNSFISSILFLSVCVAGISLWYGLTVIFRIVLSQKGTFTSPDLLTGFYLGTASTMAVSFFIHKRGSQLERTVASFVALPVVLIFAIYFLLHVIGYIETWPYLEWIDRGFGEKWN